MEYDMTNPGDATQSVNNPTMTKEFVPQLGITEIPDFETFSLDPDKWLGQVTAQATQTQTMDAEQIPEVDVQTQVESQPLPPAEGTQEETPQEDTPGTQDVQAQSTQETPAAVPAEGGGEPGGGETQQRETLD